MQKSTKRGLILIPWISYIKNNYLRRFMMILISPIFWFAVSVCYNFAVYSLLWVDGLIRGIVIMIKAIRHRWDEPRNEHNTFTL